MGPPDPLNRAQVHAHYLGHQPAGLVRRLAGRIAERQGHDPIGHIRRQAAPAGWPGLVGQQPFEALVHEPRLLAPHRRLADASRTHDRCRAQPVGRPQHNPGAPNMRPQTVAVIDDRLQTLAIGPAQVDDDASTHPAESHDAMPSGIPNRTLMSRSIH